MSSADHRKVDLVGYKVALIESNTVNLEYMGDLLKLWGCEVLLFSCVGHAIGMLSIDMFQPELLICDLHLDEDMNGFEAIEKIRSGTAAGQRVLSALLITGDVSIDLHSIEQEDGIRVIYKPIRPTLLKSLLLECRNSGQFGVVQ